MSTTPIVDRIRIIPRPDDFLDRNVGASGEVFFNRATNSLRVYSGKDRGGFEIAKTDLSNIPNAVFAAKATAAGIGGGTDSGTSISVSITAPQSPENGNLWLNTNSGYLYVYVNDGTSSQWIQPAVPTPSLPSLSAVALSGSYNDLLDKPVLSEDGQFSGSYNDLTNKPPLSVDGTFTGQLSAEQFNSTVDPDYYVNPRYGSYLHNVYITNSATVNGYVQLGESFVYGIDNAGNYFSIVPAGDTIFNGSNVLIGYESSQGNYKLQVNGAAYINGGVTLQGTTTLQQTTEVLNTKTGATGVVEHDFSTGAIWYHTAPAANFTANFTNVPTTTNRAISVVLVIDQGATARLPIAVQVDGAVTTINWQGGSQPTANVNQTDVVSFTLLRIGSTWVVLGSLTTYNA